jgi:penicillin amidase
MTMRWVWRGLVLVLLLAAGGALWVVSGAGRGPRVEGTLKASGLAAPVEVLRDAYGIPYVFAQNLPDLIRAQGFVVAQARLFQLEAYRALAEGRLAEAIGERGLASDRELRTVGLRRNAERHAKLLSPAAREFLGWYAQGLNAYIEDHASDHPAELRLAGFRTRPWTLEDMVLILHFAGWSQSVNYRSELVVQQLIDALGPERAAELFPLNLNPDRQAPLAGRLAAAMPLGVGPALAATTGTQWPAPRVGSNNWAIAPQRAASGAAVVVNDPHLDARMLPGIWFPIGLFSPEVRAVGAALPAVPGLIIGRNAEVAFGVTNAYGDSQDLFVEQLVPGKPGHYLDRGRARPFERRAEVIRVKDADAPGGWREVTHEVRSSVRGPVLDGKPLGPNGDRVLSLRKMAAELPGGDIGLDRLLVARNAAEVDRAVQQMTPFYFNYVFADRGGVIGHRATGAVPVRRSGHGLFPKLPADEDDWAGTIPADQMPGQIGPTRGWVATANHDTRPDDYPFDYSSFFAPSYRYERIAEVLDAARGMNTDAQRALMADPKNLQAQRLAPVIVAALQGVPEQADLVAILRGWDFRDRADQAAPLIYHQIYQRLAFETFVDELGEPLAREYLQDWYLWQGRFDALVTQPQSPWFDDRRTPQVETLPDLIRRAAASARAELAAKHGADPKAWRWGAEHRLQFDSPLRRTGFGRDWLGRAPQPVDGSGETVMRARYGFMAGYDTQFFASMRFVADLADERKALAVLSGGVVERQFHGHQQDQIDTWFAGELLPLWFAKEAVEANAHKRQTLQPP